MTNGKAVAVVRVRGSTGVTPDAREALRLFGLTRVNHCVVVKRSPSVTGALELVKDFITWGEVDGKTLAALIEKRGRLVGDKEVSEAFVKASGFGSFAALAEKVAAGEAELKELQGFKKVFRLHPPRKGYRSIKKRYPYGSLGNRGAEIGALITRMV